MAKYNFTSHSKRSTSGPVPPRSEEHTSELQSQFHLVCRLLLEKKNDRVAQLELARSRGACVCYLQGSSCSVGAEGGRASADRSTLGGWSSRSTAGSRRRARCEEVGVHRRHFGTGHARPGEVGAQYSDRTGDRDQSRGNGTRGEPRAPRRDGYGPDQPLFFFNDTATTEIYTLSLHDALPI